MTSPESSRVMVGCRVDRGWKEQIDRTAQETNSTPSAIIEQAIADYLGIQTGDNPLSRVDAIAHDVSMLQGSIEKLQLDLQRMELSIAELNQLRDRLKRRGF